MDKNELDLFAQDESGESTGVATATAPASATEADLDAQIAAAEADLAKPDRNAIIKELTDLGVAFKPVGTSTVALAELLANAKSGTVPPVPETAPAPEPVAHTAPVAPAPAKALAQTSAKAPAKPAKVTYVEGQKPDRKLTDTEMRDYLMSYPKVPVLVPLMPGEKKGAREPVLVNGVRLDVMKGVMVEIPRPFAEQIYAHYSMSIESLGADKLAGSKPELA